MLVKVGDHVGRDVRPRVAHLVDELLGDRMEGDAAAGSGVLGDDERPVGARLGDRVADVGQVGDRTPVVQAVPPGALRTTLEDVPGDDPRGELVPVVGAPAELVPQRGHG
jgi:hypothetical protein